MEKIYKYKRRLFTIDDTAHPNLKITLNGTKRYGYVGVVPLTDGKYTYTKFDSEASCDGIITRIVRHDRRHKNLKKMINILCKELIDDNRYDEELMMREEHRQIAQQRIFNFMDEL